MFVVTESSTGPIKRFKEMIVAHVGVHGSGLPGSLLSGLYRRSYFGLRTCGRGINQIHRSVSGLSIRVSPSHPYNTGIAGLAWGGVSVHVIIYMAQKAIQEMIDSDQGWYNAGRAGFVYNSPKHRGALDRLPFQGFARRSGIQGFMLYSRPSPVTESQLYVVNRPPIL